MPYYWLKQQPKYRERNINKIRNDDVESEDAGNDKESFSYSLISFALNSYSALQDTI